MTRVIALVALISVAAPLVHAQSNSELQSVLNRIDRLQREVTTLQRQVYGSGGPPASAPASANGAKAAGGGVDGSSFAANLQARLDEIETQIRGVTGKLEELDHANVQSNQRLDKLVSDIEFRLKALESRGGAVAGEKSAPGSVPRAAGGPPKATPAPAGGGVLGTVSLTDLERQKAAAAGAKPAARKGAEVVKLAAPKSASLPKGTPESQYKFATNLLFQSDFAGAEKAFAAFIAGHPKHKLAGNAQYWLAETYYVRKDFHSAARAFAEGYQRYPQNQKGPDNLLKLGMSLGALGKKQSACATFTRLRKDFPKAGTKIKSRTAKQRKKYSCRR